MDESQQPESHDTFARLPLMTVAHRCAQESRRFGRDAAHDPRFCFELFRRAIVDGNEHAWQYIYTQYMEQTPIVRRWVERHPLVGTRDEDTAYFANRAFEKMWMALNAEKFARFSDLAGLLRYLKLCVNSVITDHLRGAKQEDLPLQEYDAVQTDASYPEQLLRQEWWSMIAERLNSPQERTAIYCRFDAGMKPSEIQREYPDLFDDVKDVYRTLQNVLDRLRRDPAILAYVEERA